jgi:hypothetical protein
MGPRPCWHVGAVLVRCGRNQDLLLGLANASALVASIVQYLGHSQAHGRTAHLLGLASVLVLGTGAGNRTTPLSLSSPAPLVASI